MQTWSKAFGVVTLEPFSGALYVTGDAAALYAWAHRSGAAWPCSELARCERVSAELDARGDLVDLVVYLPGERYAEDSDAVDVPGGTAGPIRDVNGNTVGSWEVV